VGVWGWGDEFQTRKPSVKECVWEWIFSATTH